MKLQFIQAGEIVTTHGVRGEVKMLPWTDGPEFLTGISRVKIGDTTYKVASCRIQKTCNLVRLCGIDTMEKAQQLRGKIIEVYRCDVADDLIFASELIGMDVEADGVCIGQIKDVLDYPGNKVYVVQGEYEYMIPAVKQFVIETNLDNNLMKVKLIEGMRTDES